MSLIERFLFKKPSKFFEDNEVLTYKGNELTETDQKLLVEKILQIGKNLNVPQEALDKTKVYVHESLQVMHIYRKINGTKYKHCIVLNKNDALTLIGKRNPIEELNEEERKNFLVLETRDIKKLDAEDNVRMIFKKYIPLLEPVSKEEVEGIIAHEFGHVFYHHKNISIPLINQIKRIAFVGVFSIPLSATKIFFPPKDIHWKVMFYTFTVFLGALSSQFIRMNPYPEDFADKFASQNPQYKQGLHKYFSRADFFWKLVISAPDHTLPRLIPRIIHRLNNQLSKMICEITDPHSSSEKRATFFARN
ncbi:MAG: M48 family metalloprotease [Parachlamydiales bacterium]|nr:M48 family metalloprotease [Parachlamydiales bacterium]